ncbi:MAG: hypothetical protein CSB55_03610 [Candidatus Cloacimonadota bacterium]|nr:MAG: hypothetical protein CSB55_03610 [Candidatus Cloacimonadota bacterium]
MAVFKYPVFVNKQNKGEVTRKLPKSDRYDAVIFNKLFSYCKENYQLYNLIFVFHPNTDLRIIEMSKSCDIKTILLD